MSSVVVLLAAVTALLSGACGLRAQASPAQTIAGIPSSSTSPAASASFVPGTAEPATPTRSPSPTPSAQPSPTPEFRFIRWSGGYKVLASEPGGPVSASQDVHVEQIAGVLGSVQVDGVEWIRVQYGSDRSGDFVEHGWAPAEADIDRGGGIHVDPVYEYVVPECPDGDPTVGELGGMAPLHALYCFGSRTMTFAPVQVRRESEEDSDFVDGEPKWLAEGGGMVMYWLPEWQELGSIRLYLDPASGIELLPSRWIQVTGHLDDPAAQRCLRSSSHPEFQTLSPAEAVALCRGRFVVTGTRLLSDAEIPARPPQGTPGPEPGARLGVAVREFDGPFATRIDPSAVWTGSEMIVWGGSDWTDDWNSTARSEGAAYDPSERTWRRIPDGPLSPRAGSTAAWTGVEMLVWGGYTDDGPGLNDGAAYDPIGDRWRPISPGPLRSSYEIASVWTGSEWWVAAAGGGGVDVAAYDPASDNWRPLPSVRHELYREAQLYWTGTEALFMDTEGGVFSITPTGDRWTREATDFHGPAAWTGDLLVGTRYETVINEPLNTDTWWYPVAWDPFAREQVELARPPHSASDPVWAGDRLVYFDYGLALDPDTGDWLELDLEKEPPKHGFRSDAATVWADDRLIVWGGWSACPGWVPGYDTGYELIPEASSIALARYQAAGPARGTTALPPRFFAC